ncbi:MAG: hypothetical protein ACTHOK_11380 [Nocardioidaceae bacterium]
MPSMLPAAVHDLLAGQCGVATLAQLTQAGLPWHRLRTEIAARRWQRYGEHCVLNHNTALTSQVTSRRTDRSTPTPANTSP